jgi:S1-C subfamily serine protease
MRKILATIGLLIILVSTGLPVFYLVGGPEQVIWKPIDNVVKIQATDIYGGGWEGTGFFVADDLIMTAGHIVEDANEIWITWPDGKKHKAISWYQETEADVGIIYIRTSKTEHELNFTDPKVGDKVVAIGDPYGFFPITTFGHISGINIIQSYFGKKELVLADVALNPGNSGCPLFKKHTVVALCVGGIQGANNMCFCIRGKICELVLAKYYAIKALEKVK